MPPGSARGSLVEIARPDVLGHVRSATRSVTLVSPFLSAEVANAIAIKSRASHARTRRFLTALNERSTASGFLDPNGLRTLNQAGFEIRSILNLHAKVALTDDEWALVGSGNLTTSGLGGVRDARNGNVELGVVLSHAQTLAAKRIVSRWWRQATPIAASDIDEYARLWEATRAQRQRRSRGKGIVLPVGAEPDLEAVRGRQGRTGLWLKMMYHGPREGDPRWWRTIDWVSDGRPPPSSGRLVGGPSYQVGDLLLIYVVELQRCPAIFEVLELPDHNPQFVRRYGAPGDWKRWPWVTSVRLRHEASAEHAPTLKAIDVDHASVRQQGRIVLEEDQFDRGREALLRPNRSRRAGNLG